MSEGIAVELIHGVPEESRAEVAGLYWSAFRLKLQSSLGDERRGVAFLASQLNLDQFFCAIANGRVVGVVGYQHAGRAAIGFSYRELSEHYSHFSAPWRTVLLGALSRRPGPDELLFDGLSVDASVRGCGVGTRLIARVVEFAREKALDSVRLSVVDSNPRARALYERLGFTPTETVSMGPLTAIYGFRRSTDLVYRLDAPAS